MESKLSTKLPVYLYLFESEKLPEFSDSPFQVIETGSNLCKKKSGISINDLRFMTSILIKSFEPDLVLANFSNWWQENVGGDFNFDLISSDENQFFKRKLDIANELGSDEWSLSTSFVGYCPKSKEACNEARQLIRESDLVSH